jgi:hypothetical protein
MGYNSAIMICNDVMDQIDKDPAGWWEEAKKAILTQYRRKGNGTFGFGCSANGFQAICCEHADVTTFVAIGGNQAVVMGQEWHGSAEVTFLHKLAEKHGYELG